MVQPEFKEIDRAFAEAFKRARAASGKSQEAVAEELRRLGFDMSQPVIGKIERGQRKVSLGEAQALASAIDSTIDRIMASPASQRLEHSREVLISLTKRIRDDVEALQSAQQMVAITIDSLVRGGEVTGPLDFLETLVMESPTEIIESLERDHLADNQGRRIRDAMDEELDPDFDPNFVDALDREDSMFHRYMAKFGDTVNQTPVGDGITMLFGRRLPGSEAASGLGFDEIDPAKRTRENWTVPAPSDDEELFKRFEAAMSDG